MEENFIDELGLLDTYNEDPTKTQDPDVDPTKKKDSTPKTDEFIEGTEPTETPDAVDLLNDFETSEEVDTTQSASIASFAKGLVDSGWLEADESEITENMTHEDFIKLYKKTAEKEVSKKFDERLESLDEAKRNFVKEIMENDVDFTEYYKAHLNSETVEDFDVSDDTDSETLIHEEMKIKGFSEDEIQERIEFLKDKGKLSDTAEKAKQNLKAHFEKQKEKLREEANRAKVEKQAKLDEFKNSLASTVSTVVKAGELDGIKFTEKDKSQLVDFITKPEHRLENGQVLTGFYKKLVEIQNNPEKLVKLAKILQSDLDVSSVVKVKRETEKEKQFDDSKKRGNAFPRKEAFI